MSKNRICVEIDDTWEDWEIKTVKATIERCVLEHERYLKFKNTSVKK